MEISEKFVWDAHENDKPKHALEIWEKLIAQELGFAVELKRNQDSQRYLEQIHTNFRSNSESRF